MGRVIPAAIVLGACLGAAASAQAAPADRGAPCELALGYDVEVDPLAYLSSGYSLHVGLRVFRVRVSVGAFAAAYPDFLKPDEALVARQGGAPRSCWSFGCVAAFGRPP